MSDRAKQKNQLLDLPKPAPGPVGRINLTAHKLWYRIFRSKRNRQISVWPDHAELFVVIATAFVVLAAQFDGDIAQQMVGLSHWFPKFLKSITDAAKSHYYLIPAFLIMTVISTQDWRSRSLSAQKMLVRAYERAAFIFFAIAIPGILINIAKQLIGRGRPPTFDEYGAYVFSPFEFTHHFQSFPSGHATAAGSLGMIVALYFPRLRWPALILAGLLAFARVPANAHYLSDVMAGYLIGTFATLLIARWLASRATMFRMNPTALFPQLKK